jgi:DNA end-binding protein Ku
MATKTLEKLSKSELYERAQAAEVPGRSQMDKDELIEALSDGGRDSKNGPSTSKRSIWNGAITFGLITIPVGLYTATEDRDVSFHLLSGKDQSRIEYKRVSAKTGREVDWDDIVKGYEYEKGRFIVLTEEDFEKAAVKKDRAIDILDFVKAPAIDDRFFDKPYYLLPGKGGARAYALLREAIRESGRMGIAKFVLRSKQRLAAIETIGDALVLSTMRFRDELARLEDFDFPAAKEVRKRDLDMAQRLIDEFAAEWDPDKYTDDYRRNIMEIVEAKRKHTRPELEVEAEQHSAQVVDLMERLRKSLGTRRAGSTRPRGATQLKARARSRKPASRRSRRKAA